MTESTNGTEGPADIWQILGIDPTGDRSTIRSAYAKKLKVLDSEANADSFIELRFAYDAARSQLIERESVDPPRAPSARESMIEETEADALDHATASIRQLLDGELPIGSIEHALKEQTSATLTLLEREDLDRQDRVEAWFADRVARSIPRSDPMIPLVIAHFRWNDLARRWDCPSAVAFIVGRMRDIDFTSQYLLPSDALHHAAYLALQAEPKVGHFARHDYAALAAVSDFFRDAIERHQTITMAFDPDILRAWYQSLERHEKRIRKWKRSRRGSALAARRLALTLVAIVIGTVVMAIVSSKLEHDALEAQYAPGVGATRPDR